MTKSNPTRSDKDISDIMRKVRSEGTTPEIIFRDSLISKGSCFETQARDLPGKPDLIVPHAQLAIFVDGDFWHGGQWSRRNLSSLEDQFNKSNATSKAYWLDKIRRNMQRDCAVTASLLLEGWTVLRFWESEIRKTLAGCIQVTLETIEHGAEPDAFAFLPQKTAAEFFAGIGLMRMGLERQGWSVAFANDIDAQKYEMYQGQFADTNTHFLLEDVHKISASSLPSVTLATASFPCNDLSLAGAREGLAGKQSSTFWGFIRILEEMQDRKPPLVLLENVVGFLTSHRGSDFEKALLALNELGYSVDAFILDAARFVPQSRQRLFVVGILGTGAGFDSQSSLQQSYETEIRPKALIKFIETHPQIRWNIRPLPTPPYVSAPLQSILDDLREDAPDWWSSARAEYLLNQMSQRHRAVAEHLIHGSEWSYGTVFRRMRYGKSMAELRTDGLAGCLRTPRGGSGRQILFKAGKGQYFARLITAREASRLMGADDYQIVVPLNQALFGFGDGVCVPVVEWIATHYLNPVVSELIRGRPLKLAL
jgi:DNA (cytosine-5)-methyltransferase 1